MLKRIVAISAMAFASATFAADWKPEGSVNMMVMFPPGGGGDVLARAVAAHLEKTKGWKLVVDNRPGGGGAAMAKAMKDKPADGQTIGMAVTETYAFGPVLNPKVGYDVDDFTHLGSIADTQVGLVAKADAPWSTLEELVAAAKSGTEIEVGVFSPRANAAVRAVAKHFGVTFTTVPVKSGNEGVQNVVAGHLKTTLVAGPQAPLVRKGDLKVLASFEKDRLLVGKEAKTIKESGVDVATFDVKWMFSAPKGLPEPVAQAWTAALESLTQDPEIRSFIEDKMSLKLAFTTGKVLRQEMIDAKVANKSLIGFLK